MSVKLSAIKSNLKKKKTKNKTNTKIKIADVTADEDPPWDEEPHPASSKALRASNKNIAKLKEAAADLGVRRPTSNEDDDEDNFEEDNAAYARQMGNVAKRVNDKAQPYNSPATQELVTRQALASILLLLPGYAATAKASNGERAAYAYSNQVNLARELMNDLRSMSSTDALADRTVNEAVAPLYTALVNFLINEISSVRSKVNSATSLDGLKRTMNDSLRSLLISIGQYGQESLTAASDKTRQSLRN